MYYTNADKNTKKIKVKVLGKGTYLSEVLFK